MLHLALAQGLEVLNDVLVGENYRNDEFGSVNGKRDRLLGDVNSYKMEKEKLEKMRLEKEAVMKTLHGL